MIKLANNLSKLCQLRSKSAEDSPFWAGLKAFGSQLAEPFTGAAHYWTGGRVGSDYADNSTWLDTNRRLLNAMPGRSQYKLQYKDPTLDAAAASLGVSGLAAGAAGATLAAPYAVPAARTALASQRVRGGPATVANIRNWFKPIAKATVALNTPAVVGDAVRTVGPAVDRVFQHQNKVYRDLLAAGYSAADAENISYKLGWGGLLHAGKEYISNPYHYIYRQGGDNPIDATFVDSLSSPAPHDAYTAAREGLSVAASGPIGAGLKTIGYGTLNKLEGIPGAVSSALDVTGNQFRKQLPTPTDVQNAVANSRFYQSMRDYYGNDFDAIPANAGVNARSPTQP